MSKEKHDGAHHDCPAELPTLVSAAQSPDRENPRENNHLSRRFVGNSHNAASAVAQQPTSAAPTLDAGDMARTACDHTSRVV
eukprot:SAG31_NODE_281_length_18584_cov_10.762564_2_plen_82_part_00